MLHSRERGSGGCGYLGGLEPFFFFAAPSLAVPRARFGRIWRSAEPEEVAGLGEAKACCGGSMAGKATMC